MTVRTKNKCIYKTYAAIFKSTSIDHNLIICHCRLYVLSQTFGKLFRAYMIIARLFITHEKIYLLQTKFYHVKITIGVFRKQTLDRNTRSRESIGGEGGR